jgi:hexosaminidase
MNKGIFFAMGMIFLSACNLMDRSNRPKSDDFFLTWEFKGNNAEKSTSSAVFSIENKGKQALGNNDWALYFNMMGRRVAGESVTGNVTIEHVNGDLFRMTPAGNFRLEPGQTVEINYEKPGSLIKESEAPAGPYFVFGDQNGPDYIAMEVIHYTVKPFPALDRIFPSETGIPLPDAGWVFEQNSREFFLEPSEIGRIIPTPSKMDFTGGSETIRNGLAILSGTGLENEADYLAEMLKTVMGKKPMIKKNENHGPNTILLTIGKVAPEGNKEAYELTVKAGEGIQITGGSASGVFYGIQSLLAMMPVEIWVTPQENIEIECVKIADSPVFQYRGVMVDLVRNYNKPEAIMHLIDAMAFYKLNRLHLHLTDDEGWRLEIPSLPELTQVSGYRGHTLDSKDHLIPAYGSGPQPDPGKGVGSGFLTREEFIGLLKYANARHITIIPEINFPGHARAAIHAMEARYDRLMEEGNEKDAEIFRLIDPGDRSRYNSAQNFNDNVVCVCKEAPYLFFETIVEELMGMYREAGLKLKMIHTGGDEVPRGAWTDSPICREFLEKHPGMEAAGLQVYFEGRILEILSEKELLMAGWEEIALRKGEGGSWIPNAEFAGQAMIPYVWNSQGESLDLGNRLANAGFPVILCNVEHFYFDLAYTHHPAEPGLYWGGFVDTRRAFEFIPFNVVYSMLTDEYRRPYGPDMDFSGMEALQPAARGKILGLQGQLWSETIKGQKMLEYYYLPKMLGLAERAWSGQAGWGEIRETSARVEALDHSWNGFANVIGQREMPRLDHIFGGYHYRIPPPGGVIKEGMLYANSGFPGVAIRFTTDGSDPDAGSPVYKGPVKVSGVVKLASFDSRGRSSRISVVE